MVGAGKQKFCTAGDRTEFSDFELISVDRIMIEDIILFKIPRIMNIIVIHGVITDLNIGAGDYIFQVYGFFVPGAGIDFIIHFHHHIFHIILV